MLDGGEQVVVGADRVHEVLGLLALLGAGTPLRAGAGRPQRAARGRRVPGARTGSVCLAGARVVGCC